MTFGKKKNYLKIIQERDEIIKHLETKLSAVYGELKKLKSERQDLQDGVVTLNYGNHCISFRVDRTVIEKEHRFATPELTVTMTGTMWEPKTNVKQHTD